MWLFLPAGRDFISDCPDGVLTVADLQEILGIGRNMAYQLLNTGSIPAIRIGKKWRIPKDAVMHYLGQWKKKK